MNKATVIKTYKGIFEKAEQIKESYASALDKAKEEQGELVQAIQDGEAHLHELYKAYVLGDVSLDAYQTEQKLLQDKKDILHVTDMKIKDIGGLLTEELQGVLAELREHAPDFAKVNIKNKADGVKKILEAKEQYLATLNQIQKEVGESSKFEVMLDRLKVEVGEKDFSYASRKAEVETNISTYHSIKNGLDVTPDEVMKAYFKDYYKF
ncbi:hypothetical protein [Rossellomorea aquimaris]|uniref:hypothetical protein n=1 Tax=Rossellomorea aquimaris TaxID=189382 RepID=UPI0011E910FD|nr:hypothetical protein [Rossellomorea aquimaris]TYS87503.1 hypothetical protein FZC88_16035 [Rossellomorea aquimaris]